MMIDSLTLTLACELAYVIIARQCANCKAVAWLFAAVLTFALSYFVWKLGATSDRSTVWCQPNKLLQPHAVWHAGTAFASYAMWRRMGCADVESTGQYLDVEVTGRCWGGVRYAWRVLGHVWPWVRGSTRGGLRGGQGRRTSGQDQEDESGQVEILTVQ